MSSNYLGSVLTPVQCQKAAYGVNYLPANFLAIGDWKRLSKYKFPLLDAIFTPKLLLPARKIGQQQGPL
jgi:hypothetical protein